jgi:hypothetical protein
MTLKAHPPLEWRKANPISHADYKGFDGERHVARIYMAVSDVSMGENWHWELTAEHEPSRADQYAGQAPSHLAAADAAEEAYASTRSAEPASRRPVSLRRTSPRRVSPRQAKTRSSASDANLT